MRPSSLLSEPDAMAIGPAGVELFGQWHLRLEDGLKALPDKPEETPASAMRALWLRSGGVLVSPQAACEQTLVALNSVQQAGLGERIAKRLAGTPLAHLTERQRFMGAELIAGPEALIPRRETELLGEAAAELLQTALSHGGEGIALDVCTGSGNLALGIALRVRGAKVLAADLSDAAVKLARRNAALLGLESRVEVRQGDLLEPFDEPDFLGRVDVLVCNPPYISSGKLAAMPTEISGFEPQLAFDGGPFGIRILQRLIRESPRFVRAGGWLAFEVGLGQGPAVIKRLVPSAGFDQVRPLADTLGQVRAILARVQTLP